MYLNLGILLSFKDSIVLLQMFGKEVSSNTFMGRGGFLIELTHQRPSGRADFDLKAFEMLIFFALCPLHYSS